MEQFIQQTTADFSHVPAENLLEAVATLRMYGGLIDRLIVDPSAAFDDDITEILADYLRQVQGLTSLAFVRVQTGRVTTAEYHVAARVMDALLLAATANEGLSLFSFFNYGCIPTATPEVFQSFVHQCFRERATFSIDLHEPMDDEIVRRILQDMDGQSVVCIALSNSAVLEYVARLLHEYNIGSVLFTLRPSDLDTIVDVGPIVRCLPPSIVNLWIKSSYMDPLQVPQHPNSSLQSLYFEDCHLPATVLPFTGLRELTWAAGNDQPLEGEQGQAVEHAMLELLDNNQDSLEKISIRNLPHRFVDPVLSRVFDSVRRGHLKCLSFWYVLPPRTILERLCGFLLESCLPRLELEFVYPSKDDQLLLFETLGQCTTLLDFLQYEDNLPCREMADVLLPLLRSNHLAPAINLLHHEHDKELISLYQEVAFYAGLSQGRRLLHVPRLKGLWANILAVYADEDSSMKVHPVEAVYFFVRAKVDLWCEGS